MGQKKAQRTEELKTKIFIQEVPDFLFSNCKVLIAVPAISGMNPAQVVEAFRDGLGQMKARAEEPTPREMMDKSVDITPCLIRNALGQEN